MGRSICTYKAVIFPRKLSIADATFTFNKFVVDNAFMFVCVRLSGECLRTARAVKQRPFRLCDVSRAVAWRVRVRVVWTAM